MRRADPEVPRGRWAHSYKRRRGVLVRPHPTDMRGGTRWTPYRPQDQGGPGARARRVLREFAGKTARLLAAGAALRLVLWATGAWPL